MEHILQFAISIDDDGIKKLVEKSATEQVAREFREEVMDKIKSKYGYLSYGVEAAIKDAVSQYKDEIVDKAVEVVADSIKRSKKYREALAEVVEEMHKD